MGQTKPEDLARRARHHARGYTTGRRTAAPEKMEPRLITLRWPSVCQGCGNHVDGGSRAYWSETTGIYHRACYQPG